MSAGSAPHPVERFAVSGVLAGHSLAKPVEPTVTLRQVTWPQAHRCRSGSGVLVALPLGSTQNLGVCIGAMAFIELL